MKSPKFFTAKDDPSKDVVEFINTSRKLYNVIKNSISFEKVYFLKLISYEYALRTHNYFYIHISDEGIIPFNQLDKFVRETKQLIDEVEKANEKMFQLEDALSKEDKKYILKVYGR